MRKMRSMKTMMENLLRDIYPKLVELKYEFADLFNLRIIVNNDGNDLLIYARDLSDSHLPSRLVGTYNIECKNQVFDGSWNYALAKVIEALNSWILQKEDEIKKGRKEESKFVSAWEKYIKKIKRSNTFEK